MPAFNGVFREDSWFKYNASVLFRMSTGCQSVSQTRQKDGQTDMQPERQKIVYGKKLQSNLRYIIRLWVLIE